MDFVETLAVKQPTERRLEDTCFRWDVFCIYWCTCYCM